MIAIGRIRRLTLAQGTTFAADCSGGGIPIIQRHSTRLTAAERDLCRRVAQTVLAQGSFLKERHYFGSRVDACASPRPYIFFGDPAEIPLLDRSTNDALEYRLSLLAGDGDLVVLGCERNPGFEAYSTDVLGLGQCRYLRVAGPRTAEGLRIPTHVRCLEDDAAFAALAGFVRKAGGATLVPHMSTSRIWALARKLVLDTGHPVHVAGSPPAVTRYANDKLCFSGLVRALFGPYGGMTELAAHGMSALVARVHAMARDCDKLVLKLPSSAGSAGNFPLYSEDVAGMRPRALGTYLRALITRVVDPPQFPMVVQVWEKKVLSSPSVQLWIPAPEDGDPVIEGVFEQALTGAEGRFAGAQPWRGADGRLADLCREGMMLGLAMQGMGYFGRCSFDAVLSGDWMDSAALHWVECNGRWGGVSVPMSVLNRLFGGSSLPPYTIFHGYGQGGGVASFAEGLDRLDDLLWRPGRRDGVIFDTPSGFVPGQGYHFISLGDTMQASRDQAEELKRRLNPV